MLTPASKDEVRTEIVSVLLFVRELKEWEEWVLKEYQQSLVLG